MTELTSSRERACRKVLMELLELVNGRVRPEITPTLATVSLWEDQYSIFKWH